MYDVATGDEYAELREGSAVLKGDIEADEGDGLRGNRKLNTVSPTRAEQSGKDEKRILLLSVSENSNGSSG